MIDVAIVGLGPVGALLANFLGQAGLSVVVLERDVDIHPLPRAVHFDGETMRIFQAAAQAGSFTHAGENLNMSQSAISRQVIVLGWGKSPLGAS